MELYTKLFIAGGIIYTISVFLEVAMIIFGIAEGSPAAQVAPSIIGGFIAFCCFFVGLIIKKRCKADPNYKLPVFYRFFPVYGNLFIGFFAFMICAILLKAFLDSDVVFLICYMAAIGCLIGGIIAFIQCRKSGPAESPQNTSQVISQDVPEREELTACRPCSRCGKEFPEAELILVNGKFYCESCFKKEFGG